MRYSEIINEDLAEWNTGKWIHYSRHEMATINPSAGHGDPLGVYCFPEKFHPRTNMWMNMPYKFVITLKDHARILDFANITDDELHALLVATKCYDQFEESVTSHPPKSRNQELNWAWHAMRDSMVLGKGGGKAKWNKIFRDLGWDAVFDDTQSIHSAEKQLLILDPRIIASISRSKTAVSGWEPMKKVVADLVNLCKNYGQVEVDGPKKKSNSYSPRKGDPLILMADVKVEKSEKNYASFVVRYDPMDNNRRDRIEISLRWSNPRLGYGTGASFDIHKNKYDNCAGNGCGDGADRIPGLKKLKSDLDRIFKSDANDGTD
ncbi:unnamed protein product [Sphagnum tenellum]